MLLHRIASRLTLLTVAATFAACGSLAAGPAGEPVGEPTSPPPAGSGQTAGEASSMAEDLIARAEQRGVLPVIVRLDPRAAEGEGLSERQRVRRVQQAVLDRLPGDTGSVYRSSSGPFLTMVATAEQLRTLLAAPEVLEVIEDQPVPPTGSPGAAPAAPAN